MMSVSQGRVAERPSSLAACSHQVCLHMYVVQRLCGSPRRVQKCIVPNALVATQHVGAQLRGAEERVALAETEVREEVSNEMAELLRGMEASYKVTLPSAMFSACMAWQGLCGRK